MSDEERNSVLYVTCFPSLIIKIEDQPEFEWFESFKEFVTSSPLTPYFDFSGISNSVLEKKLLEIPNSNNSFNDSADAKIRSSYFLLIHNEHEFLNPVSTKTKDTTSNFSFENFAPKLKKILEEKFYFLEERISSLDDSKNISSETERYIAKSKLRLKQSKEFAPFASLDSADLIFNEVYKLCLMSEVEISYAHNPQIDPVTGWINAPRELTENANYRISNPFIGVGLTNSGSLSVVDYFPRKHSLNHFVESLFFGSSNSPTTDNKKDLALKKPVLMRRSPDIYALKFSEKVSLSETCPQLEIFKTFYLHSGLVPLGNYSTTGYHVDFWCEYPDNNTKIFSNELVFLNLTQSFLCDPELVRIRALTAMGGVSDEALEFDSSWEILLNKQSVKGGLQGVRLIDSVNQLVVDYRFSNIIPEIALKSCRSNSRSPAIINFRCSIEVSDLIGQDMTSLNFSIF